MAIPHSEVAQARGDRQVRPPPTPTFTLHGTQDNGAFEILWGRWHVEELPYKHARVAARSQPGRDTRGSSAGGPGTSRLSFTSKAMIEKDR